MEQKENKEPKAVKEAKPAKAPKPKTDSRNQLGVLGIIIAVVILVAAFFIGRRFDLFAGIRNVFTQIRLGWNVLLSLVVMIAVVYCVYFLAKLALRMIGKKGGRAATMSSVLTSVLKYVAVLVGFCWGLSIIGVNVSTIFAGVGVIALIIGFGAESLVADLVTGTFMLFEDQFDVGDIVEVNGSRGTVTDIGIRTTSIQDVGGNVMIVKNSEIKNLINRSNHESLAVSSISVSYEENLEELEKKIPGMIDMIWEIEQERAQLTGEKVYEEKPVYMGVDSLSDSSVDLKFRVKVSEKDIFNGRRLLNRDLKVVFDRENIGIPFPQVDVHQK
jgi:small conductance mechanosensitive channel